MDYRHLTHALIRKVRDLQRELRQHEEASEYANEARDRAKAHAADRIRQVERGERAADEARAEASYRQYQLQQATRDLIRAQSYGDKWGQERALRKIRGLT